MTAHSSNVSAPLPALFVGPPNFAEFKSHTHTPPYHLSAPLTPPAKKGGAGTGNTSQARGTPSATKAQTTHNPSVTLTPQTLSRSPSSVSPPKNKGAREDPKHQALEAPTPKLFQAMGTFVSLFHPQLWFPPHNAAWVQAERGECRGQASGPALSSPLYSGHQQSLCVPLWKGLSRPAPHCTDTATINWCPFTARVAIHCCISAVNKGDALILNGLSSSAFESVLTFTSTEFSKMDGLQRNS